MPGVANSRRITAASAPPTMKNANVVTMYRTPIRLWSVVVSQTRGSTRGARGRAGVGGRGDAVDPAFGGHREEEQRDHDPDRDRDVRDLDRDVLAELRREGRIAGAPPVPDRAPQDQAERQPSDQEPGDEEDRPE